VERVSRALTSGGGAAAVVAALVAVWLVLPVGPLPPALEVVVHLWSAAAVLRGVRRHRPTARRRWHALIAALACFALSSAAESLALSGVTTSATTAAESLLDVGGYAAVGVFGLAVLVSGRRWRDYERWLDLGTLVLAVGLTALAWTAGGQAAGEAAALPGAAFASGAGGERVIGLSVLSAVSVITGVRMMMDRDGRTPAAVGVFTAAVLTVIAYTATFMGVTARALDAFTLLGVGSVAYAALHPSMVSIGSRAGTGQEFSGRLLGIGSALLVNPVIVLIWTLRHGGGYATGVGITALTGLTLWRTARLAGDREQARRDLEDSEAALRRQAATDPLTSLANRAAFLDRVHLDLQVPDPRRRPALLFLDLDGFKAINDSLGHAAGDDLLVAVAGRLASCVRDGDVVARLGGDEFAVLLRAAGAVDAERVANRLRVALAEPVSLGGRAVDAQASIGGAVAEPGDTVAVLLHRADTAMYDAKRQGGGRYALHDDALHGAAVPRG
jgi:diguanylate cyclase (GGDEF)-like protein